MTDEKAIRLRHAREKAGYASAAEAARAFNWTISAFRHHENGTRNFGLDAARKYGRAFRVKPGWLLCMDGVDDAPPASVSTNEGLVVEGVVAAGVWREPSFRMSDKMVIDTPPPIPGMQRFGLVVEGNSMDLHYENGTVLDCVSIFTNGVPPQTGDHVIVERIKEDGLRELTVKEFVERDGEYHLRPKSSDPAHQEIPVGRPDHDYHGDGEVRVIGFVVSAIPPRSLSLMRRLGKIGTLAHGIAGD